jgi:uncharacterized protein (DUF433 family)
MIHMEPTGQVESDEAASLAEGRGLADRIVATPGVRGGKPRIAGHRITVSDVAISHERMGMSPDEIVSEYPTITLSDVYSALAYYFDHRDEVDREIREGAEFAEKLRGGAPSIFEELRTGKADAADDSLSP